MPLPLWWCHQKTVVCICSFNSLRLDYCNSLLVGCPKDLFLNSKRSRTMLPNSFFEPSDLPISLPCFSLFPGYLMNRWWNANFVFQIISHQSSIMIKTFFTLMLLPGSSALLQTSEYLEYHPSAWSPTVNTLFCQTPTTRNQLPVSITLLLSVLSNVP